LTGKSFTTWRLIKSPPASGTWNMAVDDALLERINEDDGLSILRLYAWEPACLSIGYAQPISEINTAKLRELNWNLVRRPTGGRAILHNHELTYSVISKNDNPHLRGSILESYQRLSKALLQALQILGVNANSFKKLKDSTHGNDHNPVCFEVPSNYEITAAGKKIIGSAQARRRNGILQHGSLPLTGDITDIIKVLMFKDIQEQLQATLRLSARATTLESILGFPVAWDEVAYALVEAFQNEFKIAFVSSGLSSSERKQASELENEKYRNPEWIYRI
jgi:lipoate-protein ligase A